MRKSFTNRASLVIPRFLFRCKAISCIFLFMMIAGAKASVNFLGSDYDTTISSSSSSSSSSTRRLPNPTTSLSPSPQQQPRRVPQPTSSTNGRHLGSNSNIAKNILVLLMRFTDHLDRELPDAYEYQILWNLRVSKYFEVNSYGSYQAWYNVIPWQTTDNTELFYSFDESGRTLDFQSSFHPLLDALDNGDMDWSVYDEDGDGILDNLVILHSGYGAEIGDEDCTNQRLPPQRIWSHAYHEITENYWVSADGNYRTGPYTVASALDGICDSNPTNIGVMTHEYFHALGDLIDLYDTAVDPETGKVNYLGKGIGTLDIMSNPYGVGNNDDNFPSHLSPFSKMELGWAEPIVLNMESPLAENYTVRPSELYPDIYRINLENFMGCEYLLIENRQRHFFDVNLFGTGLVIYHVDDGLKSQSYRGYPGQDNWPENGNHYRVAVLQADGKYDLEQNFNRGDAGDFWEVGDTLGPNLDGNTYPNTDTYGVYNGVFQTGVIIEVVDQVGEDIVIKVTLPSTLFGSPPKDNGNSSMPAHTPTPPNTISEKVEGPWFEGWETEEVTVDASQEEEHVEEQQQQQTPQPSGLFQGKEPGNSTTGGHGHTGEISDANDDPLVQDVEDQQPIGGTNGVIPKEPFVSGNEEAGEAVSIDFVEEDEDLFESLFLNTTATPDGMTDEENVTFSSGNSSLRPQYAVPPIREENGVASTATSAFFTTDNVDSIWNPTSAPIASPSQNGGDDYLANTKTPKETREGRDIEEDDDDWRPPIIVILPPSSAWMRSGGTLTFFTLIASLFPFG